MNKIDKERFEKIKIPLEIISFFKSFLDWGKEEYINPEEINILEKAENLFRDFKHKC